MNRDLDPLIRGLAPLTDERAAQLLPDETAAALADRITATSATAADGAPAEQRGRRSPIKFIGLPLAAAGLACAAVAVTVVLQNGGSPQGPGPAPTIAQGDGDSPSPSPGPPSPGTDRTGPSPRISLAGAALTFERKGDHIDVRVRDPLADPEQYRAEFASRGLKVNLSLVPVSPSIVGTVVMIDTSGGTAPGDVEAITARGECETGGGGDRCPVGVRVRTDYKGTAGIVFGRAARPGEQYSSSAPVTAPGEAMHGMTFRNRRLGEVLADLKKRGVTVPEYRYMDDEESKALKPGQVPPTWYVHDGSPWAKDQVLLFVGPKPGALGE